MHSHHCQICHERQGSSSLHGLLPESNCVSLKTARLFFSINYFLPYNPWQHKPTATAYGFHGLAFDRLAITLAATFSSPIPSSLLIVYLFVSSSQLYLSLTTSLNYTPSLLPGAVCTPSRLWLAFCHTF